MRGSQIFGVVLGAGAIAGAAAVFMHFRSRPAAAAPSNSPRERSPLAWHPPSPAHLTPTTPVAPAAPIAVPPSHGGSLYGQGGSYDPDYPPEIWRPIVTRLIETDFKRIDPRIAMKWLTMESDGAPCAFGAPGAKGPDGQPREMGLGQIYNPDDFKLLGLTARGIIPATFRAYCAPNTMQRTRLLTDKEMEDQVRYTLLAKIDHGMGVADGAVSRHSLRWGMADYWKLVKSFHAWPQILSTGLPAVVKKLGRAPSSWSEFRQALGMDVMIKDEDARSKTYGQMVPKFPRWHQSLNNAEKLASVVTDAGSV